MQYRESPKSIIFEFDLEVYSAQAVKSAIYDLNMVADISIIGSDRRIIQVKLEPQKNSSSLKKRIYEVVLDHQIRIDIEKETGPIRKLIVAQAFFPCENLDQLMDEINF